MNIIFGIVLAASIAVDQLTKKWAVSVLSDGTSIPLIGSFLRFSYVENRGAAFGMFQNQRWFFLLVTLIMLVVLIYIYFKNKNLTLPARLSLVLIAGGAVGNLIDRIGLGYVVDFIDVRFGSLYDFPVFNIADSCVVCGTILLLILVLANRFEKQADTGTVDSNDYLETGSDAALGNVEDSEKIENSKFTDDSEKIVREDE